VKASETNRKKLRFSSSPYSRVSISDLMPALAQLKKTTVPPYASLPANGRALAKRQERPVTGERLVGAAAQQRLSCSAAAPAPRGTLLGCVTESNFYSPFHFVRWARFGTFRPLGVDSVLAKKAAPPSGPGSPGADPGLNPDQDRRGRSKEDELDERTWSRRSVATYRVHIPDHSGCLARPAVVFEASDEFAAIARGRALAGGGDHIQVWQGPRLVGPTLVPHGDVDPAPVDIASDGDAIERRGTR
jgi:hypothetical protein